MPYVPVDTAIVVSVGPAIDVADAETLETVAYNAAGIAVSLLKKSATSLTHTSITPTNPGTGSNDWVHKGGGVHELELTAAQNDTEGELQVVAKCDTSLVFRSPVYTVVPEAVYNSLVAGSDRLGVDAQEISSSTTAADNVEANIGNLNATVSSRATQTSVDTIDGIVDAILVDTDTTIPGLIAAVPAAVWAVATRTITGGTVTTVGTGAITSLSFAASSITSAAIASNAITSAKLASSCITSAQLATDCITSDEIAVSAGTEIQSYVRAALLAEGLDHLVNAAVVGADVADNSIVARLVSLGATADWDDYDNTTDSLEAIALLVAGLPDASEINAEIVDTLSVDTYTELAATPAAATTIATMLRFLYMALRNRVDVDGSANTQELHDDAGTVISEATLADDGTTFTRGKFADP